MYVIAKLAKNRIAKNTSVLLLAQLASRLLSIVYIAALARYVGTGGIGKIATATALNGILVLVVGPGLNTLLVRDVAADAKKTTTYLSNMLFLKGLLGVPFVLLTIIATHVVGYPSDTNSIIYAYALVYLVDTLSGIFVAVFQAYERMEYEAGTRIVRELINVSLSLIAIYLRQSLLTIVLISLVSEVCKLVVQMVLVHRRFVHLRLAINLVEVRALLKDSLPFGALLILPLVRQQLMVFLLSLNHPDAVVGIYSAASSLITMLLLLPAAFSAAIFPTISGLYINARYSLPRFYQLCYKLLLIVGAPLGLGTMLVGSRVILLVYGSEFQGAAIVLMILAIYLFILVSYINGSLLMATGRQRFYMLVEGLAIAATGASCILFIPKWGAAGAAIAYVASPIATFVIYSVVCHRQLRLSFPWLTIGKVMIAASAMGLVSTISLRAGVPWLIVLFVVAPITYGLSVLSLSIVKAEELQVLAGASSPSLIKREAALGS